MNPPGIIILHVLFCQFLFFLFFSALFFLPDNNCLIVFLNKTGSRRQAFLGRAVIPGNLPQFQMPLFHAEISGHHKNRRKKQTDQKRIPDRLHVDAIQKKDNPIGSRAEKSAEKHMSSAVQILSKQFHFSPPFPRAEDSVPPAAVTFSSRYPSPTLVVIKSFSPACSSLRRSLAILTVSVFSSI